MDSGKRGLIASTVLNLLVVLILDLAHLYNAFQSKSIIGMIIFVLIALVTTGSTIAIILVAIKESKSIRIDLC